MLVALTKNNPLSKCVNLKIIAKSTPGYVPSDLSSLVNLGDHITASQIILPAGVKLITKEDEIIIIAESPKEETIEVEKTIEDIEVEKKGKKEEAEIEQPE